MQHYNETQLLKLVADVEREFTAELAKAEEFNSSVLAKAEGAPFPPKKKEDKKPEAEEEAPAEGEAPAQEAAPEQEAAPAAEAAPEEQEAQAPAEAAPAQEGNDYDSEDMEHMKKMYMSMSKGELKAH